MKDKYNLQRFVLAQEHTFEHACRELQSRQKTGHWMWYMFPQLEGLGSSPMSQKFAISSLDEAKSYLAHPILGTRIKKLCNLLLKIDDRSMNQVFGYPDDLKLKSSMTLFAHATSENSDFMEILEKHFGGKFDIKTLSLLGLS